MFGIRTWRALRRRGVMGINQRNGDYVLAYNDRRLYPLVDDKIRTKKLALDAGIQVPDMYGIIDTEQGISKLQHIVETHGDFVIKPAQGAGGDGIMVISDRFEGYYRGASGRMISPEELEFHISGIISGIYSLGGHRDRALIAAVLCHLRVVCEPLVYFGFTFPGVLLVLAAVMVRVGHYRG